jgi:hypothetical protein
MKSESKLFVELWEIVRDQLPAARRADTAFSMLQAFEEHGYDSRDLADIVDEDPVLARAFNTVFDEGEEEADETSEYENE